MAKSAKNKKKPAGVMKAQAEHLEDALAKIDDVASIVETIAKTVPGAVYGNEHAIPADRRARLVGERSTVPKSSVYPDGLKVTASTAVFSAEALRATQVRLRQLREDLLDAEKRLEAVS